MGPFQRPSRLIASGLACVRGGRRVFASLDFSLAAGEAMLVTGPNGAGKSSLLRLVGGLLHQTAGQLTLEGGADDAPIGEQAHYLGHQDALKLSLSVAENLSFWVRYLGGSPMEDAGSDAPGNPTELALDAVGLASIAGLPAGYLSAGQRRRLSVARLIAVDRPLWLLDEPTTALDTNAQGMLAAVMRTHLAAGGMILAATHGPIGLDGAKELRMGGGR